MLFGFYNRNDREKELINKTVSFSRLQAAKFFAERKNLDLKSFLKLYAVTTII